MPECLQTKGSPPEMNTQFQKKAKIMQTSLEFSYNAVSDRYMSVEDALKADLYQTIDVEVKVLHKSPVKETLLLHKMPDRRHCCGPYQLCQIGSLGGYY